MIYNHIGQANKEDEIDNIVDENIVDVNKSGNMSL